MLDDLFVSLLDLSGTASIVILVVMAARLGLKRLPKGISYALWAVVLLRLLCPLSFELPISLIPEVTPVSHTYTLTDTPVSVVDAGVAAYHAVGDVLRGDTGVQYIPIEMPDRQSKVEYVAATQRDVWILFGQYVWLAGVVLMLLHSLISYIKLRKCMAVRISLEKGVYLCDDIDSPFVMGVFRPAVYLPSGMETKERSYILAHEQYHIRRMDPLWKLLGYAALTLHWFNPLVWVAFVLACKDMEMSCDEAVIRQLGAEVRAEYAASLASLATGKRIIAGTPLAFGEGDPKSRIRNLAKWKKPAIWAVVTAVCLSLMLSACLMVDPAGTEIPDVSAPPSQQMPSQTTQPQSTELDPMQVPSVPTQPQSAIPDPTQKQPDVDVTNTPFVLYFTTSFQGLSDSAPNDMNVLAAINPESGQVLLIYTPNTFYMPNPARNGEKDPLRQCGLSTVENARQALSDFYQVPIPYYVRTSLQGVMNLVDMLGGVTINSQIDTLIGTMEIQAGESVLSGRQVLSAAEHYYGNKYPIEVLGVLLRKLRSGNLDRIASGLEGQIDTNMTLQEAASLQKLKKSNGIKWNIGAYAVSGIEDWVDESLFACMPDMVTVEYAKELIQQVLAGKTLTSASIMYEIPNSDTIRIVKTLELSPQLAKAEMKLDGRTIVSITDDTMLRSIRRLFANAEWLGYEPKTFSAGPMLTLTGTDGTVVKTQLGCEFDLMLADGLYYDYGPGYNEEGALNAILHMLQTFGLNDWPDWVYQWYEDNGWTLPPPELMARYP